jgi:anaphase-promoting complex subunit 8
LDDFSNVLFVLGDRRGLSSLALDCFTVDPFRAESNCVAGNLYGMLGQHDKSLMHFRRAVSIDPSCVAAWTLLGHEYLEVHNTSAAVAAYRTAVTLDEREYRAWYGLGQIYELLQLFPYALHYYQRTTSLRPSDARMWVATAGCLEKLCRPRDAVACLERAAHCEAPTSENYTTTLRRIAQHCASTDPARAATAYKSLLAAPRCKPPEVAEAQLFLVAHFCECAEAALEVPPSAARAPSFDPYQHEAPRRSGAGRLQGKPSFDARREEAGAWIDQADSLMEELSASVGANAATVVARRDRLTNLRRMLDGH